MSPVLLLSLTTFASTMFGGLFALRQRNWLHLFMGFTAGVLIGLVAFDLLPEVFVQVQVQRIDPIVPMIALVGAFLLFHIAEKSILIHRAQDDVYVAHKHPQVGVLSALALSGHSFLDGVGIGLGFKVSASVGISSPSRSSRTTSRTA